MFYATLSGYTFLLHPPPQGGAIADPGLIYEAPSEQEDQPDAYGSIRSPGDMALQTSPGLLGRDCGQLGRARGGLAGQVTPGNVAQGLGRAGFHALGMALTQEAFRGPLALFVEVDQIPGTGPLAQAAADAGGRVNNPGAGCRVGLDGVLGTGRSAGHGMGALAAGVLNEQTVSPGALHRISAGGTFRAKGHVPSHLDPGQRRLGPAIVKFRARQLAAQAAHTTGGVGQKEPLGVVDNNHGRVVTPGAA